MTALSLANLPSHDVFRNLLAVRFGYVPEGCMYFVKAGIVRGGADVDHLSPGPGPVKFWRQGQPEGQGVACDELPPGHKETYTAFTEGDVTPLLRLQRILLKGHNARQRINLAVQGLEQGSGQAISLSQHRKLIAKILVQALKL
jgi:hypothetical protein